MHCERILFPLFLFLYILTGITLAITAYLLRLNEYGYNKYGYNFNRPARYYIGLTSLYILFTCFIQLITIICCKKRLILFRIAIVLLILGIIFELTAVALFVFIRSGLDPATRKKILIAVSSLTGYLIILQIYGVIASLSYHSEIRYNYREVQVK